MRGMARSSSADPVSKKFTHDPTSKGTDFGLPLATLRVDQVIFPLRFEQLRERLDQLAGRDLIDKQRGRKKGDALSFNCGSAHDLSGVE